MIEEILVRIAVALEKIVETGEAPVLVGAPEDKPVEGPKVSGPTPILEPTDAQREAERISLKAQLRERGIKFKEAARTDTLRALLDAATRKPVDPLEDTPPVASVPTAATPPVQTEQPATVTIEAVRDALIALSNAETRDIALGVLKKVGKVDKITLLPEEDRAKVVEACKKRMEEL